MIDASPRSSGEPPRLRRVRYLVAAVRSGKRGRRAIARATGFTEAQINQVRAVLKRKRQRRLLAQAGVA